jgi:hypothetical protein
MYIFKPIELSEDESYYKRFESWFISNEHYVFHYDEIVSAGYKTSLPIQSQYLLHYDLYIQGYFPEIHEIRKNNGLTPYDHTITINENLTFLKVCYPVNHKHEEREIHIEVGRFGPRFFRNKEEFEIIFRNDYFSQLEGDTKVELSHVTNNSSLTLNTTSNTFDDLRVIDSSKKSNFRYFTQPLTLFFDDSEVRETEQNGVPVQSADYQINKLIPNNSTMHIGMVIDGFIYWKTSINYRPLLEEDFIYDNFTGMVYKYKEGLAHEFSFLDPNLFFQSYIQISSDYIEQEDLIGYRFGTLDFSVYSKISSTDDPLALKFLDLGDDLYVLTEPLTRQEQIEYKNLCDLEYGSISESMGTYSVFMPAVGSGAIASPVFGPTSLTVLTSPADGPTGITHLLLNLSPTVGPTSLTHLASPTVGPTSLTHLASPAVGPTSLTHLASPAVGPTSLTHLASPAVGPTSLTSTTSTPFVAHIFDLSGSAVQAIPSHTYFGYTKSGNDYVDSFEKNNSNTEHWYSSSWGSMKFVDGKWRLFNMYQYPMSAGSELLIISESANLLNPVSNVSVNTTSGTFTQPSG